MTDKPAYRTRCIPGVLPALPGTPISDEERADLRPVTCPHCGKIGGFFRVMDQRASMPVGNREIPFLVNRLCNVPRVQGARCKWCGGSIPAIFMTAD